MLRNIYLNNLFLCQFFYCVFSPMNWNPALRVLPGRALPAWAPLQPRRPLRVEAVPAMHVGHHPVDRGTHSRSTHFFNLKNMTFEKTSWIWNMTVLFYVLCTLRKFCQFTVRAMKKSFRTVSVPMWQKAATYRVFLQKKWHLQKNINLSWKIELRFLPPNKSFGPQNHASTMEPPATAELDDKTGGQGKQCQAKCFKV